MKAISQQSKRMESRRSRTQTEKDEIKFEDFDKVEIRVAEVKEVEKWKVLTSCFNSA